MRTLRFAVPTLLSLSLLASGCGGTLDGAGGTGSVDENVVGGTFEPNYQFPWEVVVHDSCHGVLIDPSWVLTAAHCVPLNGWGHQVSYTRTDPYDGSVHSGYRMVTNSYTQVFIHPGFVNNSGYGYPVNDVALIRLDSPFTIDPYIQTVAIPTTARVAGTAGAIASISHTGTPPPGDDAVLRTTIPSVPPLNCVTPNGAFCISSPTASLCDGDSGSGFVTVEGGRATVRGVVSFVNTKSCQTVTTGDFSALTDVAMFHDWIVSTMKTSDASLAGNTRVHATGRLARGVVGLGCTNNYGTMWGPMNVSGSEIGANCLAGDTEAVVCSLSPGQTDPILAQPVIIRRFTMKTTTAAGVTTTTNLPITSTTAATYYDHTPSNVTREFTCEIGLPYIVRGGGGVISAF